MVKPSALDFEIIEHTPNKRGDGSRFFAVEFRPSSDDLRVLSKGGVHSNHFWAQIPDTSTRIVTDAGRFVTRSGVRIAPDAIGTFPPEDARDPWRREQYARDVTAEAEANIRAYWERKLRAASEGRFYPQRHRTTLNLQVGASADDANQFSGIVQTTSTSAICDSTAEHFGYRWQNVTIPPAATIDAAIFTIFIGASGGDEPQHQVRGQLSTAPAAFTTGSNDISDRTRTTATVQWNSANLGVSPSSFEQWGCSAAGGAGTSVAPIVQELVDQGAWASGGAFVFIVEQHTDDAARDLQSNFFDNDSAEAAKLDIDYTAVEPIIDHTATGGIVYGGASVLRFIRVLLSIAATGGLVYSSDSALRFIRVLANVNGTGGIVLDGDTAVAITRAIVAAGGYVYGGTAGRATVHVHMPAGGLVYSGAFTFVFPGEDDAALFLAALYSPTLRLRARHSALDLDAVLSGIDLEAVHTIEH